MDAIYLLILAGLYAIIPTTIGGLLSAIGVAGMSRMTRGSLTTFSIANDVAKYFAIIPAAFSSTYPQLGALNIKSEAMTSQAVAAVPQGGGIRVHSIK
jgi:high-affinity K+ transport system ATPase subunit B